MRDYWTCSAFADWLRGTMKPRAATGQGWVEWKQLAKQNHPFRYWLAEEGLDYVQSFLYWPWEKVHAIRYYINNRWITHTHALTAHPRDLPRGQWCDVGNRFVPCLFNELVDFVEIELAWSNCMWNEEAQKQFSMPWWRRWYRQWRSEEAAMAYLAWAKSLTNEEFLDDDKKHEAVPTPQATSAAEIEALYKWWKYERPLRPDPYKASGWSAYCDSRRAADPENWIFGNEEEYSKVDTSAMLDRIRELEAAYNKEDEEMLIRLIKIRDHLWT